MDDRKVSARVRNAVKLSLQQSARPLSIPELQQRTGRAYPTVKQALEDIGATQDRSDYPAVWHLPDMLRAEQKALGDGDDMVLVPLLDLGNLVARWNNGRENFGKHLLKLEITEDSDVDALAATFLQGAKNLVAIAYLLQENSQSPDWFTKIGGNDE